jgi:3-oxoacyl-[acyl-carrier-protein] synthase-3
MPATVNVIADRLGINHVPTYQVQSGCAGAVQAVDIARLLLSCGEHRSGLVLAGDSCRKHMSLDRPLDDLAPDELVNYVLFGDGAGALVLSTDPGEHGIEITTVLNRVTGLNRTPGQTIHWFGQAEDPRTATAVSEDYRAIEEGVPVMATEIVSELLDETGWEPQEVDWLLPPQLSGRMTAAIVERIGLRDAREISRVADTGNSGNALPLLQLNHLFRRMRGGERALVVAVESSKWIKAALALEKPEAVR